ncbi:MULTISPECIES: hypothetical protein [Spirulina sp. CCY15215]|uniref:hypothetical protein n=1 Tax=Spirulina sp. CCY15215 TaxID=2767591 RepID=UPI00194FB925
MYGVFLGFSRQYMRAKTDEILEFNGGFFILNKKVLDFIESTTTIWEQEPLQKLVNIGELAVYEHTGFWQCMDTYREMEFLNELWLNSSAPWRVW